MSKTILVNYTPTHDGHYVGAYIDGRHYIAILDSETHEIRHVRELKDNARGERGAHHFPNTAAGKALKARITTELALAVKAHQKDLAYEDSQLRRDRLPRRAVD